MSFFDPSRASYRDNPYPALAALRREDPLHWSAALGAWVSTRYSDCSAILHDARRFTSDPALTTGRRAAALTAHRSLVPLGNVPNLGTTSGDLHRALRHVVNPVFTPAAVRKLLPAVAFQVESLLDTLPRHQPFDVMAVFAVPLPRMSMVAVMGCPQQAEEGLQRALLAIELTRTTVSPPVAMVAAAREAEAAAAVILAPYVNGALPAATVLGALMPAGPATRTLAEVTSLAAQIATVGAEPTTAAVGNALLALARRPEACEILRREPDLIAGAANELLRFDSPTHIIPRFATAATLLAGKHVRAGDTMLAVVGAANRDPTEFACPDELDPRRDARRHLAFGQGEHICLGAPLAMVILQLAIAGLLRRFAHMEITVSPEYGPGIQLRRPATLRVMLD
jgi:cytochrome P450